MPSSSHPTVAEREAELAALQSAFDEYIASSRELEEELDAELAKMQEKLAESSAANAALSAQLENIAPQLSSLEKALSESRSKLKEEQRLRRAAESSQDDLQNKVRELEGSLFAIREECDAAHEELAFKENELEETKLELDVERERHRVELDEAKADLVAVQQQQQQQHFYNQRDASASTDTSTAAGGSMAVTDEAVGILEAVDDEGLTATAESTEREEYVKRLEEELELVTEQLIDAEQRLANIELIQKMKATEEKADTQAKNGNASKQVEALEEQKRELMAQVDELNRKLEEVNEEFKDKERKWTEQLEVTREELRLTQDVLKATEEDGRKLQERLDGTRTEHRDELQVIRANLEESESQRVSAQRQAEALENIIKKSTSEISKLQEEVHNLEVALENANKDNALVMEELEAVNERFDQVRQEAERNGQEKAADEARAQLKAQHEREIEQIQQQLAQVTKTNSDLQQKLKEVEAALTAAREAQIKRSVEDMDDGESLGSTVAMLELQSERVRELQTQLDQARQYLEEHERDSAQLKAMLESRMSKAEETVQRLEKELAATKGELAETQAHLIVSRRENSSHRGLSSVALAASSPLAASSSSLVDQSGTNHTLRKMLSISSSISSSFDESRDDVGPLVSDFEPRRLRTPSNRRRSRSSSPSTPERMEFKLAEESNKAKKLQEDYEKIKDQKRMGEVRLKRLEEDLRVLQMQILGGSSEATAVVTQMSRLQEQQVQQRKYAFLWSLAATLPILCLTMIVPHVLPSNHPIQVWLQDTWTLFHHEFQRESFILWILATPVQFISGWTFYQRAYYNIVQNQLGMDVLVVLGTTASYGYALVATIGYGHTKAAHHDHQEDHGAHFFETSAVLICFVLLGKWMNALAVRRTSDALTQLMRLQAKTAIRVVPTNSNDDDDNNNSYNKATVDGDGKPAGSTSKDSPPTVSSDWNPTTDTYHEQVVPIDMVHTGDIVKVIRGTSIPADGIVLYGEMTVDESMITGESVPILKTRGSMVLGGTVCVETATDIVTADHDKAHVTTLSVGAAFCVVTGVGSSTALAQIVQLVQDAQTRQVPIQNFADTISAIFVPTVATISVVTFLVWYALCNTGVVPEAWYSNLQETTGTFSLMFGVACLVISCPCALGLATPTAVMVGTGVGAQHGVLLKGGEALEKASQVNSIVFDKTGTLTKGKPEITDCRRLVPLRLKGSDNTLLETGSGATQEDELLLWLMASLERNSEHPLATAVVAYANAQINSAYLSTHPFTQPSNFRALTGRGASGTIAIGASQASATVRDSDMLKVDVAVGNRAFCTLMNIAIPLAAEDYMTQLEDQGKTAILATVNNEVCAVLGIADELKPDAGAAISYLRDKLALDVWMVTGDNARTANAITRRLNLPPDRVISEALPVAKVQQVIRLQNSGRIVAMVGDGVNDSPALAQADVGMSLGTGAEIAAEASDMVLVRGNLQDVCTALNLSRVIFRRIQWNFVWSLFYNCLGIPVAAGVFFPLIHTRLPPTVAALAMALSSLSVVSSSLALRLYKPPKIMTDDAQEQPLSILQSMTRWFRSRMAQPESNEQQHDLTVRLLDNDHVAEDRDQSRTDPDQVQRMEEGCGVTSAST